MALTTLPCASALESDSQSCKSLFISILISFHCSYMVLIAFHESNEISEVLIVLKSNCGGCLVFTVFGFMVG
jgi:hypothetical protein